MIKVFCKFSSAELSVTNQFNNFASTNKNNKLVASVHPVMELNSSQLLKLATAKAIHKYSNTERHILLVALIKYTGVVAFDFPINKHSISANKTKELLPHLIDSCLAIHTNAHLWEEASKLLPVTTVTADSVGKIDIESWYNLLLLPATDQLKYSLDGKLAHPNGVGLAAKLPDEIDIEHALSQEVKEWNANNKKIRYSKDLAIWSAKHLFANSANMNKGDSYTRVKYLMNAPIEKIKSVEDLESLRKELADILPRTDSVYSADRTNTILVLRHLDSRIESFDLALVNWFGCETEEIDAPLPSELGISYTIKKAVIGSGNEPRLASSKLKSTPEQTKAASKSNPALAALLAMKST